MILPLLVFFESSALLLLGGTGRMIFGWFGFGVTTKFESEKATLLKQIIIKNMQFEKKIKHTHIFNKITKSTPTQLQNKKYLLCHQEH